MPESGSTGVQDTSATIARLRQRGVGIGVSGGTKFMTHDGAVWLLRRGRPALQGFGTIAVGSDTFIGGNCLVMPNISIGSGCILGAGAALAAGHGIGSFSSFALAPR